MEKRKLILASASPRRREILSNMGLNFQVHPACGEEKLETSDPVEAVKALALQKAREVADKTGEPALVIGSDTVVASGNKILGKPHDKEEAFRMLKELQGASHMVYTGVAVIDTVTGEPLAHFAEGTKVSMYPMTDAWIQDYIETGDHGQGGSLCHTGRLYALYPRNTGRIRHGRWLSGGPVLSGTSEKGRGFAEDGRGGIL